jgi:hypothetical protein
MVEEEQMGPNLCCGISGDPVPLSKIVDNDVSATILNISSKQNQLQGHSHTQERQPDPPPDISYL